MDTFSSTRDQLDGLCDIDRRGNGVRRRELIQRDDTEREVLCNEGNRTHGSREKRGENGESIEDHVGQLKTLWRVGSVV